MLQVHGLEAAYGPSQILFGVDLTVGQGEVVGLIGRNGMGKTTTIRSLFGLTRRRAGDIRFDGHDLRALSSHRISRLGLGLVPEGRQIFPSLSVRENLLATARGQGPWDLPRILELFAPLASRLHHAGNHLSGGEQQMLAVARTLMTHPRLLILDEATEGLAPALRQVIWRALAALKRSGLAILVVDPSLERLLSVCDRFVILENGRSVWHGTASVLRREPDLARRYLAL